MKTSQHSVPISDSFAQRDERLRFIQFKRTILIGLLLGCVCSFPLIQLLDLDLYTSSLFYTHSTNTWDWCDKQPFSWIDHTSVWFTTALAISFAVIYALSQIFHRNSWENRASLIMLLVMLTGPVLLVNTIMKPTFSRARPREIQQFGGHMFHTPAWQPSSSPYLNSSFPSGHSSIGFYLVAPAFLVQRSRFRFIALLIAGLVFGSIVGFSRVVQGGHFLSDVLCSMFVMTTLSWLTSEFVYRCWPVLAPNQQKVSLAERALGHVAPRKATHYSAQA